MTSDTRHCVIKQCSAKDIHEHIAIATKCLLERYDESLHKIYKTVQHTAFEASETRPKRRILFLPSGTCHSFSDEAVTVFKAIPEWPEIQKQAGLTVQGQNRFMELNKMDRDSPYLFKAIDKLADKATYDETQPSDSHVEYSANFKNHYIAAHMCVRFFSGRLSKYIRSRCPRLSLNYRPLASKKNSFNTHQDHSDRLWADLPTYLQKIQANRTSIPKEEIVIQADRTSIPKEEIVIQADRTSIPMEEIGIQADRTSIPMEEIGIQADRTSIPMEEIGIQADRTSTPKEEVVIQADRTSIPKEEVGIQADRTSIPKEEIVIQVDRTSIPKEEIVIQMDRNSIPKEGIDILNEYHHINWPPNDDAWPAPGEHPVLDRELMTEVKLQLGMKALVYGNRGWGEEGSLEIEEVPWFAAWRIDTWRSGGYEGEFVRVA
ncbi:hypothetical protein BC936DRAFT_145750 [Jimgerdemannia flammicorona]|uniref:Uncharacterized protein n=1 Tax=Jimgerdemannia flammicorona TaxID=994334 RepID=A0A433D9B7_9FUNG|nr:hypothetical protein BC936DRAFT_145750 [Jimgerdemannia flammicorona]